MSLRVNTNVSAINTLRVLSGTDQAVSRSIGRLSSGFRINRAADDAAGLGIANKLRADIGALNQATRNAEQANALLQVAEGGAQQVQGMLERMKELATQSASDNVDGDGRARIDTEFQELLIEIDRIADSTKFQGRALLDGTFGAFVDTFANGSTLLGVGTLVGSVSVSGAPTDTYTLTHTANTLTLENSAGSLTQVLDITGSDGVNTFSFDAFGVSVRTETTFAAATATATGDIVVAGADAEFIVGSSGVIADDKITLTGLDLTTAAGALALAGTDLATDTTAEAALGLIDTALTVVADAFSQIGAKQNRLDFALANVRITVENFAASESVIRDADMAAEFTELTKNQILAQAGIAVLAQANQQPQRVLSLLG